MTDQNKNEAAKPYSSVWLEASENIKKRQEAITSPKTGLEVLGMMLEEFQKAKIASEARKTPAQLAIEKEQAALRSIELQKERELKEKKFISTLYDLWLKRDTWLVFDEATYLSAGKKPQESTIFDTNTESYNFIKSCAGHSLEVLNIHEKPNLWRVKPFEWVRWLKEKQQTVHPELLRLLYPTSNAEPTAKTTKASNSRSREKVMRQKAIKQFALDASEKARKLNIPWNSQEIAVTKLDFIKVFSKEYPDFKNISGDTFDRDIADIGLKFKSGTKSNKNNALKDIFSKK